MRKGIHPDNYRLVAFKDMSNEDVFLAKSAAETKETLEYWIENDWNAKGIGYYMVRELKTNAFIGYVGVALRPFKEKEMLNFRNNQANGIGTAVFKIKRNQVWFIAQQFGQFLNGLTRFFTDVRMIL